MNHPRKALPGDPDATERLARILRVDHAGEYGARRIYEGQLAVLGESPVAPTLRRMLEQERAHLKRFEHLLPERQVRPSALQPLWHLAGFALGAATALLGEKAAMTCTVAVEEVIETHYRDQAARLEREGEEPELQKLLEDLAREEREHHDLALSTGAGDTPEYQPLRWLIQTGSRLSIWLAERW